MTDVDKVLIDDASAPKYTVSTVARQIGVPTATLRSWSQRYGIGPETHRRGQHRLFSDADVAVVHRMHKLMTQGVAARAAAQTALQRMSDAVEGSVALLLDAALSLDAATIERILHSRIRRQGAIDVWEQLIRPTFAAVEARYEANGDCVDVEHVLSSAVARSLQRSSATPAGIPSVVLCCNEFETHTLPLEALRCALAERGCGTVMLGASTPASAIRDALQRLPAPTTVVLFAQTKSTAKFEAAAGIASSGARLLLAGDGWSETIPPAGVTWLESLNMAVRHVHPCATEVE